MLDQQPFDLILKELQNVNHRLEHIETGQKELSERVSSIENRMSNFENGQKELTKRVSNIEDGQTELTKRVGNMENGQTELTKRVGNMEKGQKKLTVDVGNLETELKDFRTETKTALQIIMTGQQGTRTELTQRFKEVQHTLGHLETDIAYNFQKTAQLDLEIYRLKKQ